jgi:hypothetical protein
LVPRGTNQRRDKRLQRSQPADSRPQGNSSVSIRPKRLSFPSGEGGRRWPEKVPFARDDRDRLESRPAQSQSQPAAAREKLYFVHARNNNRRFSTFQVLI